MPQFLEQTSSTDYLNSLENRPVSSKYFYANMVYFVKRGTALILQVIALLGHGATVH